jgi:hypothetical protein
LAGAVVAVACALFVPAQALAVQSSGADPEELFQQARALIAQGRYEEACAKLAESEAIEPAVGTEFQLARCYELQGRTGSAWHLYERIVQQTHAAGQDAREAAARARMRTLEPQLTRVTIAVAAETEGLEVTIDDRVVARDRWTPGDPIDPGSHVVRATAPGHTGWSQAIDVDAGSREVTIPRLAEPVPEPAAPQAVAPGPAPPLAAPAAPHDAPAGPRPMGTQRVIALVVGGAAIAAIGTGLGFGARSLQLHGEADRECGPTTCTAHGLGLTDDARSAGDVATTLVAAGGAVLAAAAVLWLAAPSSPTPPRTALRAFGDAHGAGLSLASEW